MTLRPCCEQWGIRTLQVGTIWKNTADTADAASATRRTCARARMEGGSVVRSRRLRRGRGLVGWMAWERGFDIGALVGMEQAVEPAPMIAIPPAATAEPKTDPETVAAAADAVAAVETVAEAQGGFDQRLAAMEQRLARLDLQAQAASGNAARAEGLLIAFATRRSMERGAPLGYLADQLRLRFGDARPNAVRTIIEASRDPVTLDQLMARLEGLSPNSSARRATKGSGPGPSAN